MATKQKTKEIYSPWLHPVRGIWVDTAGNHWCCLDKLMEYFNLRLRCGTQIRFRISSESQGDDYRIRTGFAFSFFAFIETVKGPEYEVLYKHLGRALWPGCWVGLESREVLNGKIR